MRGLRQRVPLPDGRPQDRVGQADGTFVPVALGELHGFMGSGGVGNLVHHHQLVQAQVEDQADPRRQRLRLPAQQPAEHPIQAAAPADGAVHQFGREGPVPDRVVVPPEEGIEGLPRQHIPCFRSMQRP